MVQLSKSIYHDRVALQKSQPRSCQGVREDQWCSNSIRDFKIKGMAITVEAGTQKSGHSVLRMVCRREKCTKGKKGEHQVTSIKRRPNLTHHPHERIVVRTINSLHKSPIAQMIENRTLTSLRLTAGQPEDHCHTCSHLCPEVSYDSTYTNARSIQEASLEGS